MLPSTSHLRRLLAVCLLFLLLPFCACAEEDASPARVCIAVDRENQLPLAGLLAYRAERQGAQVSMYSISRPEDRAFYTSESGVSIQDSFSRFDYRTSKDPERLARFNNFLHDLFDGLEMDSAVSGMDIYVLSDASRYITTFTNEKDGIFKDKNIRAAYEIIFEKMTACPHVRLHFYFPVSDRPPADKHAALDDRLIQDFGDRVSCEELDYKSDSLLSSFISSDSLRQRTLSGPLPPDGRIAYERKGTSEWLMLSFPPEAEMADVRFSVAEQPEAAPLPSFHDAASNTCWLYLPEGTESRAFTIDCQRSGEASDADSYTLKTWSALPAFEVSLYDAQHQRIDPHAPFSLLSEASSWTLELHCPGFTFDDLSPVFKLVLVHDQADGVADGDTNEGANRPASISSTKLACAEAGADGDTLRWTFALPALPPETTGQLSLDYHLWNDLQCSFSWDFSVPNRAPIPSGESPASFPVYAEIPLGTESKSYGYAFNLNDYFTELDTDDPLTFSTSSVSQNSYSSEIKENMLIYTPNSPGGTFAVDVTAQDQHGGSADLQFSFKHLSMRIILEDLRLEPEAINGVFSIPIMEEKPLRFRLRDDNGALKTMQESLHLPAFSDCLKITINGTLCQISQEENGDFIVSYTIPASDASSSTPNALLVEARFEYTPSGSGDGFPYSIALDLPHILNNTSFSYVYTNSRPICRIENQSVSAYDIDGLPGKYEPVLFSRLFHDGQPLQLDQLFVNEEANEPLTYTIQVKSGRITVSSSSDPAVILGTLEAGSFYPFTAEDAARPLELSLDAPGRYEFEIYATDSGGQSSTVAYSAKLNSSFMRRVLIAVISAIVLAALTAATLVIRHLLKPSFKGLNVCIRYLRGEQEASRRTAGSMDTWLPLDPYHKDAVSLMALLTASGHLPPQACPPEVLMRISLAPGKDDTVWVACGAEVKASSVEICIGDQKQESIRHFALAYGQTLKICFWKDGQRDTFWLLVKRASV